MLLLNDRPLACVGHGGERVAVLSARAVYTCDGVNMSVTCFWPVPVANEC